jgi:RNA polymerase sigma factor (sigma-70 family)
MSIWLLFFLKLTAMTHQEFTEIFNAYHQQMILFANKLLTNKSASEDVVADAFASLWTVDYSITDTKTFLYKIVRNNCFNHNKHTSKFGYHLSISTEEFDSFERKTGFEPEDYSSREKAIIVKVELATSIAKEIESLPPEQKKVVKLLYSGYNAVEISGILKIAESTVNTQLSRFRSGYGLNWNEKGRPTFLLTYDGKTQSIKEWAAELGISCQTIYNKHKQGLPIEEVLKKCGTFITYKGETRSLKEWSKILSVNYITLFKRYNMGWSAEKILTGNDIKILYNGKKQTVKKWSEELGISPATIIHRYNKDLPAERILSVKKKETHDNH